MPAYAGDALATLERHWTFLCNNNDRMRYATLRAKGLPCGSGATEGASFQTQFDTANAHIAEGLIWASLCAAVLKRFLAHAAQRVGDGTAMSTRRVAMCAHHILDELITALRIGGGLLRTLRRGLAYLLANAQRANPDRDRRTGRLRAGLAIVEPA